MEREGDRGDAGRLGEGRTERGGESDGERCGKRKEMEKGRGVEREERD